MGTALNPIDPLLAPLAFNGGPTQTMALLVTSLAIDHGANPLGLLFDQRGVGFARTSGPQTDIGAFELQQGCPLCPTCPTCPTCPDCPECPEPKECEEGDHNERGVKRGSRSGRTSSGGLGFFPPFGPVVGPIAPVTPIEPVISAPAIEVPVPMPEEKNISSEAINAGREPLASGCSTTSNMRASHLFLIIIALVGLRAIGARRQKSCGDFLG